MPPLLPAFSIACFIMLNLIILAAVKRVRSAEKLVPLAKCQLTGLAGTLSLGDSVGIKNSAAKFLRGNSLGLIWRINSLLSRVSAIGTELLGSRHSL